MSFVKLHRSLREHPYAGDPDHLALWTWLLMLAAFKEHPVILNKCHITLKPGDLVTSLRTLSSRSGINAFAGGAAYNASKIALNGFSEALMLDKREEHILGS